MKKTIGIGLSALALAVAIVPMNANASESINCQFGNSNKVIIWNGNCDISSIQDQLKDCLNSILGSNCPSGEIIGDSENNGNSNNAEDSENENIGDSGNENVGDSYENPGEENSGEENPEENSYVQQVVNLVNIERAKEGLSALKFDETVAKAADVRALEIQSSFSHTRPDGSNFYTVLTQQGINYRSAGENIAYGQRTPEEVVNGWMNSAGHRANIMNVNYENIGIGYQVSSNGTPYWVQLFTK